MSKRKRRRNTWNEFCREHGFSLIAAVVIFKLALLIYLAPLLDRLYQQL